MKDLTNDSNPAVRTGTLKNIYQRILHKIAMVAPGGSTIRPNLHRMRGVKIGSDVWISQYVYMDENHPEAITIGANSSIGLRVSIFTHFYWGPRRPPSAAGPVIIEEDVFVGPHCVILPNVRIGRGAVIKAGTVVSRDVPPGMMWGNPNPEALGRATIPLTAQTSYEEFVAGLRPIRKRPASTKQGDTNKLSEN